MSALRKTVSGAVRLAPCFHRRAAQPVLHQCLGRGEIGAGVDAGQILDRQFDHAAAQPAAARDPDDVGQVELALGVVAVERRQEIRGGARGERHDAAIDQADGALFRGRVGRLDDAFERTVSGQHEPSVGAGIRRPQAGNHHRGRCPPPLAQQPGQGRGGQQRGVAEQHQQILDIALWRQPAGQRGEPGADRVAGAERRVLHDALCRLDQPGDRLHPRPDHGDCRGRRQRAERRQQMADHRPAGERMHDFGDRGFHSRAAAGGEDDGGETGLAHRWP